MTTIRRVLGTMSAHLGAWLIAGATAVVVTVFAQTQPDVERRLNVLEGLNTDARLVALETRLSNIESVGKGVLVIVAAQLVLGGLNLKRRP